MDPKVKIEQMTIAAQAVLEGFDRGVFVRSTEQDHQDGWALSLLRYVQALCILQEQVNGDFRHDARNISPPGMHRVGDESLEDHARRAFERYARRTRAGIP